ncbi:MAG: undecaprenyldiphospho-muramoylpentapeptide beta-N-acetylglucosaminyltransferase [Pseudomonadota bacterium]
MTVSVLIMAGGTGGHVFPALAVARLLAARHVRLSWLGTRRGLEARVVPASGLPIQMEWLAIRGLRRKGLLGWLLAPITVSLAAWQAWRALRRQKPDVVLAFGGFVAGPGGLVAWLTRTPLVVHEQNAIPGFTNRLLAPLADHVLSGFPGAFGELSMARHVGNPVRADIAALPTPESRFAGHRGRLKLLVIGGSQGAAVFNEVVPATVGTLAPELRPEIWHQCGRKQLARVEAAYRLAHAEARVSEFIDDMAQAYAWADLVLCRAGAMTVAELAAAGIPAILVPYLHAVDDHQTANAKFLSERGAAILIAQGEFHPGWLRELLLEIGANREPLLKMALAARACAMPDAAEAVADICVEASGGGVHG